jgi:hypothetical protein
MSSTMYFLYLQPAPLPPPPAQFWELAGKALTSGIVGQYLEDFPATQLNTPTRRLNISKLCKYAQK